MNALTASLAAEAALDEVRASLAGITEILAVNTDGIPADSDDIRILDNLLDRAARTFMTVEDLGGHEDADEVSQELHFARLDVDDARPEED